MSSLAWPVFSDVLLFAGSECLARLSTLTPGSEGPGLWEWCVCGQAWSVVSKMLTRFHVATLGRRIGCFLHKAKTLWSDLHVGEFPRVIICKTRFRICDPKRKTKCDPIDGADGNTKVCAALKFPKLLSNTCGGSQRPCKYFSESGGRQPWIMPPDDTQSSFPPSLLCTSPKGSLQGVELFSALPFPAAGGVQSPVKLASFPVLTAQFAFLCVSTFFCLFVCFLYKSCYFFLIKLFIILGASSLTAMHVAYILFHSVCLFLN